MKNTVIFSKYSNERNRRFAIHTDILEDADGKRCIRKVPEYPEGEAHVQALFHWYNTFSEFTAGTRLGYNRCRLIPEGAELEYLTGISLEEYLLSVEKKQGIDACAQELLDYLNFIKSIHVGAVFEPGEEFREVFGDVNLPVGTVCAPCTDIDLLCENILLTGENWTAIDYEWSFSFPIPVNFLLFRIIFYFTAHANRGTEFENCDFYGKMGITAGEIAAYEAMETHFQKFVCSGYVPIRDLYDTISEGFFQVMDQPAREVLQVYFDYGEGFREDCSNLYSMKRKGNWHIHQEVSIPNNTIALRIDPGSRACMVRLKTLRFDNQQDSAHFRLREGVIQGEWLCFAEDDPNIILQKIPHGAKSILIDLELCSVDRADLIHQKRDEAGNGESRGTGIIQKLATAALRSR